MNEYFVVPSFTKNLLRLKIRNICFIS